jgi:phosphatidylglycerophosphate synthase
MRKIYYKYENPINHLILHSCDKLIQGCVKYNITPNMITIGRLSMTPFILYYLYYTDDIIFTVIATSIFYYLDCLDGHLARSTNQVTKLGDFLDHFSDILLISGLLYYIYTKSNTTIIMLVTLLFYMTLIQLGLQQKHYKLENPNASPYTETLPTSVKLETKN